MSGFDRNRATYYVAEYNRSSGRGLDQRIHVKTFGRATTACGLTAAGMRKEWELPTGALDEICRECQRELVAFQATIERVRVSNTHPSTR